MSKIRRLIKTWHLFYNQVQAASYDSRLYDEEFKKVVKLASGLATKPSTNKHVCTKINKIIRANVIFVPSDKEGIEKYRKLLFWSRQSHHEKNLKEIITAYEMYCQSVAYKFLIESKTEPEILKLIGKYIKTDDLKNLSFKGREADLSEALITVFVKEKLQSPTAIAEFFRDINLIESWELPWFESNSMRVNDYKKIRNIYEHGGGHTRYYHGQVLGLENYSRVFISSHTVIDAAGVCKVLAQSLRRSYNKKLRRKDNELYELYETHRQNGTPLYALKEMRLNHANFKRLLNFMTGFPPGDISINQEILRLLVAANDFYKSNRYEISKTLTRVINKKTKYHKATLKAASKIAYRYYLKSLDMQKRYLHVVNSSAASRNGYLHCLHLLEIDSNFLTHKDQYEDILIATSLAHTLDLSVKQYAKTVSKKIVI